MIEILLEACPQASLQLYIAAQSNHFDGLLTLSIGTSVISVIHGIVQGSWSRFSLTSNVSKGKGGLFFCLVFTPWLFAIFFSFIVPLSFLAALRNHAHPAILVCAIYFPYHITFYLSIPYFRRDRPRQKWCIDYFSFIPQLIYSLVSLCISTCWIVSLAPFLNEEQQNILPSFVWPNTVRPFHRWKVQEHLSTFNETWAICSAKSVFTSTTSSSFSESATISLSSFTLISPSVNKSKIEMGNSFHLPPPPPPPRSTTSAANPMDLSKYEFCLTDVAAPMYYAFIVATFIPFLYGWFDMVKFFEKFFLKENALSSSLEVEDKGQETSFDSNNNGTTMPEEEDQQCKP